MLETIIPLLPILCMATIVLCNYTKKTYNAYMYSTEQSSKNSASKNVSMTLCT